MVNYTMPLSFVKGVIFVTDYKNQLISDVSLALTSQLPAQHIEIVSDELSIALRDYEVTKSVTDLVAYDGANEMILKRYKACLVIEGRSPKTIYGYERTLLRLFHTLQKNFVDMTVSDLRYFLACEKSRGISNRTLENTRVRVQTFFAWLVDEELVNKNPCRNIAPIKFTKEVKLPFSSIEIDAMRSACKTKKERAIIEFLLASGVRVSELCAMHLNDINFDTLTVIVREGKGAKQRTVYINELASKHLIEYLSTRNINGEFLLYNKWKKPINAGGIRHILNQIGERAEVNNVYPHRFRRTFATNLSNRGMEIQDISALLGHENLNTTMMYVHTSADRVRVSYLKYSA